MAEDQITLRYFSVVNGSSGDRYVFLRVASSSTMQDVIETIATQMKQQLGRIVLWKVSLRCKLWPLEGGLLTTTVFSHANSYRRVATTASVP